MSSWDSVEGQSCVATVLTAHLHAGKRHGRLCILRLLHRQLVRQCTKLLHILTQFPRNTGII